MRQSEKQDLVIRAGQALKKAVEKYEEIAAELEDKGELEQSDLAITLHDSLKSLQRKISAYLTGKLNLDKLIDEFLFEYELIEEELETGKEEPVRLKRLGKRMLSSYEDFIAQVGGKKKLKKLEQDAPHYATLKSKKIAYLLWFFGVFGILGLHRFYLGKAGTGIAWLFTGGLFGMGALYDLFALPGMVEEENTYHQLRAAQIRQLTEGQRPD